MHPVRTFSFGPFLLIPERHLLLKDGVPVRIGGRSLDLLTALVERPGKLLTKQELIGLVWPNVLVGEDNLKVNLGSLRRVLGEQPDAPLYIATVTGLGYRFIGTIHGNDSPIIPDVPDALPVQNHNLPAGTVRIFGRDAVVDAIHADLLSSKLISLVGPGGVGKTTVALAAAETFLNAFRDGVWMVELAPVHDARLLANAIATSLGLATPRHDNFLGLCQYLGSRELLLILDSCEHLVHEAARCVDQILAKCPGVRILVTSREALGLPDEQVLGLDGLGVPPFSAVLTAAEALRYPAIELFVDRATDWFHDFTLTDANAPLVANICRRLDGLALAIELAAPLIDTLGVEGVQQQLNNRFHLLAGRRGGPERHRTLEATLDWSYGLLTDSEARALRSLSVFAGKFKIDGAGDVAELPPTKAAEILTELAAKSLIATEISGDVIDYRLLESTRAFCLERLSDSGEDSAARRRHAEYVIKELVRAGYELAQRPAHEWRAAYMHLLDDARSALAWPGKSIVDRARWIELTVQATPLWIQFSMTDECLRQVSHAIVQLPFAGLGGTATEMELQIALAAAILFSSGPLKSGYDAGKRGCQIADQLGNTSAQLNARLLIVGYEIFMSEYALAVHTLTNFDEIANKHNIAALRWSDPMWAWLDLYTGRLEPALQRVQHRLQSEIEFLEDDSFIARLPLSLNIQFSLALAMLQWLMGSPDAAVRTSTAAIDEALKSGHSIWLCNVLAVPACQVALWSGNYEVAHSYQQMLGEHLERNGLGIWQPDVRYLQGTLASAQDDMTVDAVAVLQEALRDFDAINHRVGSPYFIGTLASAQLKRGNVADATVTIDGALERAGAQGEIWCVPELLRIRASISDTEGRNAEAKADLGEAMRIAQEIGALSWQLRAATDLAQLLQAQSQSTEARAVLLPVYQQFSEGFETRDLRAATELLSIL